MRCVRAIVRGARECLTAGEQAAGKTLALAGRPGQQRAKYRERDKPCRAGQDDRICCPDPRMCGDDADAAWDGMGCELIARA